MGSESPFPYTEVFRKQFPYYLSIGMSPDEYWDGDNDLCRYYRKADELKRERKNHALWLQGMYVYDALIRVNPIFHDFVKRGTKPTPYPEEPYPITERAIKESRERKEKATAMKGLEFMKALMASINEKFNKERK